LSGILTKQKKKERIVWSHFEKELHATYDYEIYNR